MKRRNVVSITLLFIMLLGVVACTTSVPSGTKASLEFIVKEQYGHDKTVKFTKNATLTASDKELYELGVCWEIVGRELPKGVVLKMLDPEEAGYTWDIFWTTGGRC